MRLRVTLLDIRDPDIALEALTVDDRGENRDLVIFVAAVKSGQVKRKMYTISLVEGNTIFCISGHRLSS
ncbi:MAG: hypothetical protein GY801_25320 [bacterium]|nr:hypothetical protein [bacterium]